MPSKQNQDNTPNEGNKTRPRQRYLVLLLALFTLLIAQSISAAQGDIKTVAGNGTAGSSGDGGAATSAQLNGSTGIAIDEAGNIYIADSENHVVRKVDPNGVISTAAGTGEEGFLGGDGGLATNARLSTPSGVDVDKAGNLFIADQGNMRVRKVDTNGIISTVAGTGFVLNDGINGIAAIAADLTWPTDVAFDETGNLFIVTKGDHRVFKVDTNGIITTVVGYKAPDGESAFGFSGDGGAATSAKLDEPSSVAVDGAGNIFIADYLNRRIRKVDTNGIITTFAGGATHGESGDGGPASNATLSRPTGVTVDEEGNVFIADKLFSRIRKVDTDGIISTVVGSGTNGFSGDGGAATSAELNNPHGVAFDRTGNLYISDQENQRIRMVEAIGAGLTNTIVVEEGTAGSLAIGTSKSGVISVTIGANALPPGSPQTTFELIKQGATQATAGLFKIGGVAFTLNAYQDGQLLENFTFNEPLQISLTYPNASIGSLNESTLEVLYYDKAAQQWKPDGITIISRDSASNTITVSIQHLTEFGLFAPLNSSVWIPMLVR